MNLPAGVSVSIFSLWLMRVTALSVRVSIMFSKSFVERPRRLILSMILSIPLYTFSSKFTNLLKIYIPMEPSGMGM